MTNIFIYGSIRKGNYNHSRFGFDKKTKFLGEDLLKGALIYNLGSYPCIVLTNNEKDVVYGELYEYLDEDCEKMIKRMEERIKLSKLKGGLGKKVTVVDQKRINPETWPKMTYEGLCRVHAGADVILIQAVNQLPQDGDFLDYVARVVISEDTRRERVSAAWRVAAIGCAPGRASVFFLDFPTQSLRVRLSARNWSWAAFQSPYAGPTT